MAKKKIIKTKARPKAKTRAKARAKANAKVKHKPSTKRTLEEVLSSLQDLTKNELSDADLHSRAGTEPEKNQVPGVPTENAGQGISDNKTDHSENDESIELDVVPDQAKLISGETGDIFEGLELLPGVEITDENQIDQTEQPGETNQSDPELHDIHWEDIPVLEEVAEDLSEDLSEDQSGAVLQDAGLLDANEFHPPDPQQARNIAIQVAARLNIEMHKQGLEGLDIATINRLRDLLVRELAKAAAKSENDEL